MYLFIYLFIQPISITVRNEAATAEAYSAGLRESESYHTGPSVNAVSVSTLGRMLKAEDSASNSEDGELEDYGGLI